MIRIFIIFALLYSLDSSLCSEEARVTITQGELEGVVEKSRDDRDFYGFMGIPYGKIPKRFGISEPADSWQGVKKVIDSGDGCVQYNFFDGTVLGDEDCLVLNVFTPKLRNDTDVSLLPVMVWMYGGGFIAGAINSYDASYFMDEDVVLVLMNYRLGVLGFLNTGTSSARGNMGLKDQVLALKWVQNNIHHFSGNKDSVSILGESAGALSVSYMVTSPMAQGLFHRGIMQSGAATHPSFYNNALGSLEMAKRFANSVDCPSSNPEYIVQCLQRIDPKILGNGRFIDDFGPDESIILVGPSYETYSEGNDDPNVFMKEDPYIAAKEGRMAKVPLIMGLTHTESAWATQILTSKPSTIPRLNAQWTRRLSNLLHLTATAEDPGSVCEAINQKFFGGHKYTNTSSDDFEHLMDERYFTHPLRMFSEAYSKHTDVYLYNLTIPVMVPTASGMQKKKPSHGNDLGFIFKMVGPWKFLNSKIDANHEAYSFSKHLVKLWVSFAKEGKPGPLWGSGGGVWPKAFDASVDQPTFLYLDNPLRVEQVSQWYKDNGDFWNSLSLKQYGKKWISE